MIVDGEFLSQTQVQRLLDMVRKDAMEYAGQFYDRSRKGLTGDGGRSEKFRAFWMEIGLRLARDPQDCFVAANYDKFIEDVLERYTELMQRPDVKEEDKYLMHLANIVHAMLAQQTQHTPIQLKRDSQQFAGDRFENREIIKTYGDHAEPALIAKLLQSSSLTRH